jgi:hypothetical protein
MRSKTTHLSFGQLITNIRMGQFLALYVPRTCIILVNMHVSNYVNVSTLRKECPTNLKYMKNAHYSLGN